MKKPSPLAARMLRAMIRHDVDLKLRRDSYSSSEPYWIGHDGREEYLSLRDVNPKKRNVIAALKNGWLEFYKTEKGKWSIDDYYRITEAGRSIIANLDDSEFLPKKPEISHDQLKMFMKKWYETNHPTFIYLPEFPIGGGTTVDGYGISLWHSLDFRAVAYEMKASRADFLSELRQDKYRPTLQIAHQFFFVTPKKLAGTGEIPDPCGLIEIDKLGRVHIVLDSPYRNVKPPNWQFVALLLRHARKVYKGHIDEAGKSTIRYF